MILGDFIKDWGGLILSSLGIIGGIWAYIRHDKKLKIQEIRLNEFQIKQFEKEENKEKMADMKCNVIRGNWKSHAALTLLAKQDCPLWLQYD